MRPGPSPRSRPGRGPDVLPWWGWLLLWAVLVVGGGAWVAVLGRRTWRSARALGEEVARAGALVAELEARLDEARDLPMERPAVLQDPRMVREEHRRQRAESKAARRARRMDRRPPWARVH